MSSSEVFSRSLPSKRIEPEIRALPAKRVRPITVSGEAPHARDVEDGLGEDSPAEQDPEVEAEDGDDRRDGRAHAVLEDDGPLAQALRARGADVVLGHRLEQVAAQEAGVDRGERRGED